MTASAAMPRFAYEVQTPLGRPMRGTLHAPTLDDARKDLTDLRLLVISIAPDEQAASRPLTGDDFNAFNQQLAQLTAAGMPVEQGLRLIGREMSSPRLSGTIREVLSDLDSGMTLPQSLDLHARQFPPLYGRLVDAGIRMNNLPATLFNLSRHLELVKRMRGAIWRAAAYPLMVGIGVLLVLLFLSYAILPQFTVIFSDFHTTLPLITRSVMWIGRVFPPFGLAAAAVLLGWPLVWFVLSFTNAQQPMTEMLLSVPFVGSILRRNMIARWCDILRLGVESGLDLPRALQLASDALASKAVSADTQKLLTLINAGNPLDRYEGGRVLTPSIGTILQLSSEQNDLPAALARLAAMHHDQAEYRVQLIPAFLSPLLIAFMAFTLGTIIVALFLPLVRMIQSVSGGM